MDSSDKTISLTDRIIHNFVEKLRPEEKEIRAELDVAYTFDGRALIVNEVRPRWDKPTKTTETAIIKGILVKADGNWKIYWMRASGKWERYTPFPTASSVEEFFDVLEEDKNSCFWG